MTCIATFSVTGWEPTPYDEPADGPSLSRVTIRKTFDGDLVGDSVGEGLFCSSADPADGAGYVVSERVTGRLADREGSFVIQHGGIVGPGIAPTSFGNVVPGSGTAGLLGLRGTVTFAQTDGQHTLTLEAEFVEEA